MKYDIYFVLNSAYIRFGKIFLKSLYDKVDMNNVRHIYLSDTGLNEQDKKYVESFDKVKVVDSGIVTDFKGGSWGEDWHKTVASKTIILRELLNNNDLPIMMVDGDCMFVDEVGGLIDNNYDIQICHRPNVLHCPYLASFVVLQPNQRAKMFLDKWIEIIENTKCRI